jgi:transcriptional regulator with XRE-family HTH domain
MKSSSSKDKTGVLPSLEGFAGRLNQLRTHYQMGQRRFAEWLGLPPTTYHEYEKRKRQPLLDAVVRILERTGVSAGWLLQGLGPMFAPDSPHKVIRELRKAAGKTPEGVAEAMGVGPERYRAFESGDEVPDLTADFQGLAEALGCDPVTRQRLFDAIEREFRPVYFRGLVEEETPAARQEGPQTGRFGKFLEPAQLRALLDRDEECFRLYQAQPLARKASLVMQILRNGIEDPKVIREMIYDNFAEIKILDQVKTLLASGKRGELVSYVKFLLHRAEGPDSAGPDRAATTP